MEGGTDGNKRGMLSSLSFSISCGLEERAETRNLNGAIGKD